MFEIKNLQTGYGKKQVLFDTSLEVKQNEIIAIIGPNGAGKSTILKTVCGLIPAWNGEILFDNTPITGSSPAKNVSRGITFCPQGNRVFDELSVIENLQIGGIHLKATELKERINDDNREVILDLIQRIDRLRTQYSPNKKYTSLEKFLSE